ncbi:MAG: TrmH family RNA methyltransferase [Bdellovibrionota bacterium]
MESNLFLPISEYEKLNEQMKISHILKIAKYCEKEWGGEKHQRYLESIKSYLQSFETSKKPEFCRLAKYTNMISGDLTLNHYLSILIAIERIVHHSPVDHDFLITSKDKKNHITQTVPMFAILDNIRSAFNVGSIFRTSECLSMQKIYLCGYTATPEHQKTEATAMGTDKHIEWQWKTNSIHTIKKLKQENIKIIALETTRKEQSIYDCVVDGPTALVVGNERFGLHPSLLKECNDVREVPTYGLKNSLNVGVAYGIAASHISQKLRSHLSS